MVGVSQPWAALDPWAEPSAKLRRTHHLSLQVFLVTVKSVIYSNEGYSFLAICARKLTATMDDLRRSCTGAWHVVVVDLVVGPADPDRPDDE